eukprot:COSAG03_NODE_711_length_6158_cov_95.789734_3_plen_314_part_00
MSCWSKRPRLAYLWRRKTHECRQNVASCYPRALAVALPPPRPPAPLPLHTRAHRLSSGCARRPSSAGRSRAHGDGHLEAIRIHGAAEPNAFLLRAALVCYKTERQRAQRHREAERQRETERQKHREAEEHEDTETQRGRGTRRTETRRHRDKERQRQRSTLTLSGVRTADDRALGPSSTSSMAKRLSSIDVITKYETNRNADATKKCPPGPHRNHAGVFGLVKKTMRHTVSQIHTHTHQPAHARARAHKHAQTHAHTHTHTRQRSSQVRGRVSTISLPPSARGPTRAWVPGAGRRWRLGRTALNVAWAVLWWA